MSKERISLDAIMKHFIDKFDIPTRADVDKVIKRIQRLETMLKGHNLQIPSSQMDDQTNKKRIRRKRRAKKSAADVVLDIFDEKQAPIKFKELKKITGFEDKKLRNIVFRLNTLQKIECVSRGVYQMKS